MSQILSVVALDEPTIRRLESLSGVKVRLLTPNDSKWDAPDDAVRGTDILLCKLPPRNLDALTDLKMIQLTTVGYEHLRHLGFAERPVRVCNARGLFDTAIAEWNLAMMINLTRDLRGMIRNQEQAKWEKDARFQQEIRGKVVGLWGYGGIGRETARLAKAFGMTVHVLTRSGVGPRGNNYALPGSGDPDGVLPDRVFTAGKEADFLSGLDFLVLALPHTKAEHWPGRRERTASAAALGVCAEPGTRADHSGGGAAGGAARGLDCGSGARHALCVSTTAGASAVALSQRDPDAAHLRGG